MAPGDDRTARPDGPPPLTVERSPGSWRIVRITVLGVAQAVMLVLLDQLLDGVSVEGFASALAAVVILAVLNAVAWPFVVRVALPVVLVTLGLFTFVLNALFVSLAAEFVDG
ncbi:MAG: phage holin family protein, partial [Actinomycetota bacterium]